MFRGAADIERMFTDYSLRFSNEISGYKAKAARLYSIEAGGEDSFWPTFWREDQSKAECSTGNASCTAITFSGEGALVWETDFLKGSMPGVTDKVGCALSLELALSLFGSIDIIGMKVDINDETKIVRGVFEGTQKVALLSVGEEDRIVSWQVAELSEGPEDANKSMAESYSIASGLGRPSAVIEGESIVLFASRACFIAVIILTIFIIVLFLKRIPRLHRGIVVFAACIVAALILPSILRLLPGWTIPDLWSDFSHWESLSKQFENGLRDLLGKAPYLRDVEGKLLLLKQGVLLSSSTLCSVIICLIYGRSSNGKHNA